MARLLSPCQLSSHTLTHQGQDQPGNSRAQGRTGRRLSRLGRGVLCDMVGGECAHGGHYDTAHTMRLSTAQDRNTHNVMEGKRKPGTDAPRPPLKVIAWFLSLKSDAF